MSIFSRIFGTPSIAPKTVDDIFDSDKGLLAKAGEWFGNRKYTEEEQAENDLELARSVQTFVVATLDESTDRSVARRQIAVFFIKFYALMLFMAGMVYPIDPGWSAVWVGLATSLSVGGLVTAISIFFFGSHAAARIKGTKDSSKK